MAPDSTAAVGLAVPDLRYLEQSHEPVQTEKELFVQG